MQIRKNSYLPEKNVISLAMFLEKSTSETQSWCIKSATTLKIIVMTVGLKKDPIVLVYWEFFSILITLLQSLKPGKVWSVSKEH